MAIPKKFSVKTLREIAKLEKSIDSSIKNNGACPIVDVYLEGPSEEVLNELRRRYEAAGWNVSILCGRVDLWKRWTQLR